MKSPCPTTTLGTLAAIRAIVAVHATYNKAHLLAQLDAAIEDARRTDQEGEADA